MEKDFRLKKIDEARNCLVEKIERNELVSKKHKKVCTTLNHIEHLLILDSAVTGCVSISAFASLFGIPGGIASSAVGLKICAITAVVKKYKSIIEKKKKKHDKIKLWAKTKLNRTEVLISKALFDSYSSRDEIVSINNVLKKDNDMKGEIKNLRT